ncbi:DUF6879 family protein [Streptomyces boetiae]|uniref:DUF6879 family protein n=1 Tax=Streptomyces boetiae TaxID=3075541 RepID=UPI00374E09AA
MLAVTHFRPDGKFEGAELTDDPAVVASSVRARDRLWALADSYEDFWLNREANRPA